MPRDKKVKKFKNRPKQKKELFLDQDIKRQGSSWKHLNENKNENCIIPAIERSVIIPFSFRPF